MADDENVSFAYTVTGTHKGDFMGIAPTGKTIKARGLQISKFEDGKMVERWGSTGVTGVLKDLCTPVPPMDAKANATLEKIKSTPAGPDLDKVYIKAQLENHEFLRDLAQSYISKGKLPGAAENQGRRLASCRWLFLRSTLPLQRVS